MPVVTIKIHIVYALHTIPSLTHDVVYKRYAKVEHLSSPTHSSIGLYEI